MAQPPQSMGLVMEVHEVQLTEQDHIEYRMLEDLSYIIIEREGCKRLFLSGVAGDVLHQSIREQSHEVFSRIAKVLETEGMPVFSIIRQWNYIEKITACDATGHQHYQDFNDARSLFYNGVEWTTGYPAATGIGTQWGGIMIDVDALLCKDGSVRVLGVDNPLQIAAHAYSQNVLLGEKMWLFLKRLPRSSNVPRLYGKRIMVSYMYRAQPLFVVSRVWKALVLNSKH